jgi:phenylacetate-CoA ligase
MRKEIESRYGMKAYDIYGLTEIIGPGATLSTKNPT